MNIVLVKPKSVVVDSPILPLSLVYLGTYIRELGHTVTIIDCPAQQDYLARINRACEEADLIGLTVLSSEVQHALELSDFIKAKSSVPVAWGGWHATLFPEQTCADSSVDFVVSQEGEKTFAELLSHIESDMDFSGINGLTYKIDGSVIKNSPRLFLDMNELPSPDYELVDVENYLKSENRWLPYQSSRGCPYRCRFCINVVTGNNRGYRSQSSERLLSEVERLTSKYQLRGISFTDDNFFISRKRVKGFCEGLVNSDITLKWTGECRADYFRPGFVDQDLLALLDRSGLFELTIGAESGSQRMLEKMDKNLTVENILQSAEYLKDTKIVPGYSFILGVLGEEEEDILATLDLTKRLVDICPQAAFGIGTLRAYPGSELTKEIIDAGFIPETTSVRDWTRPEIRDYYLGNRKQKWHTNGQLPYLAARYANLAANTYSDETIGQLKRDKKWWAYPTIWMIYRARKRMELLKLSRPFDLRIYDTWMGWYPRAVRLLRPIKRLVFGHKTHQ